MRTYHSLFPFPFVFSTFFFGGVQVLREAWPGLGEVVSSKELENDRGSGGGVFAAEAPTNALAVEDVDKLLAQLMPAIKVRKR
jgi:hypothetical protein